MKNDELLMIVLVFIIGYMASDMINNMCDGKLVEGFSFANWFKPDPRSITGADGKEMPSNATGCYGDNCKNPMTKSIDEHVNKTISRFNSSNTDNVSAVSKSMNEYDVTCLNSLSSSEVQAMSSELSEKALGTGYDTAYCAAPTFCSGNTENKIKQLASGSQTVTIHNVATYSPVSNLADTTNMADVVAQQTKFKDSSITGNSDGPHNSQTMASIDLKGKDISRQSANFYNLVNLNASQNTENKIVQTGTPVYTARSWKSGDVKQEDMDKVCGEVKVDQHSVANQTISVTSSISNQSKLKDIQHQGTTIDADNKRVTDHENTNLNKIADTAKDAWDHTVDGVAATMQNEMDDLTDGVMAGEAMLPATIGAIAIFVLVVVIGLIVYKKSSNKKGIQEFEMSDMANMASSARKGLGNAASSAASSYKGMRMQPVNMAKNAASAVGTGVVNATKGVASGIGYAAKGVASGVGYAAKGVASGVSGVGRSVTNPLFSKKEKPKSGGGFKTLLNTLDTIKLSNEQLIMIITIIFLLYNIYR